MLEDWDECLENGRDFVAAKGEKIARLADSRLGVLTC